MRLFFLFVMLFLVGCSAKYIPPKNGNEAQVRIVAPGFGGWAGLRAVYYENGSCELPRVFGIITGLGSTKSDIGTTIRTTPSIANSEYFDRFVSPGKTSMTFGSSFMNKVCKIPLEVIFEPNKSYEIHHSWSNEECHINVYELSENGTIDIPVHTPVNACLSGFEGAAL